MKTVLIFGYGYVSAICARQLMDAGYTVFITSRRKDALAEITAMGATAVRFGEGLPKVDAVLNTVPPVSGADPVLATYKPADFGHQVQWYGYLSTTGVYGNTHGKTVDETTAPNPITEKARARYIAELTTLKSGLPAHVFRLAGIYGPGRNALERLQNGHIHEVPAGNAPVNRIHVRDIGKTILASINAPHPGRIYNVCDDLPSPTRDVIFHAAALLNRVEEVQRLPEGDELLLGPMGGGIRMVSNNRLHHELKITLDYPSYREGLAQCLQAMQHPNQAESA